MIVVVVSGVELVWLYVDDLNEDEKGRKRERRRARADGRF